jgi:glutamate/tyrosine decarboxylase-like PLP-dependent enzyme
MTFSVDSPEIVMTAAYRATLDKLRVAFPQPVSDRVHDSYLVHSFLRALDRVDDMKSALPRLGGEVTLDYDQARQSRLREDPSTVEEVTAEIVRYFEGMTIYGHPRQQQNVVPPPTIPGVIGTLLASLYNPNLAWDEYSKGIARAEVETIALVSALIGYDPAKAGGVFTFGGTGTTLYGIRLGIEKACPGSSQEGLPSPPPLVFASDTSHYCRYNIATWLGIGMKSLRTVPTNAHNALILEDLATQLRTALKEGRRIACIVATMGTTDAFGLDDLAGILELRDELVREFNLDYVPHVHADAVIGWAWSVFNDYNVEVNSLGFRRRTLRALAGACRAIRHLERADSIGIDFHKTGFAPYISSLFLTRDRADLLGVGREAEVMPYLFQHGEYRPGMYTLETSRAGTGVLAALANLRLFGKQGMRVLLGHMVEMAHLLQENLDGHEATTVVNRDHFGTVTLFRVYPPGIDTFTVPEEEFTNPAYRDSLLKHNDYNRQVAAYVHNEALAGRGVMLSLTDCYRHTTYGEPIVALKSYILSPFVDEEHIEAVVRKVLEAREKLGASEKK